MLENNIIKLHAILDWKYNSAYQMIYVFLNATKHSRVCRPQQILNTARPTSIRTIHFNIINVLKICVFNILKKYTFKIKKNTNKFSFNHCLKNKNIFSTCIITENEWLFFNPPLIAGKQHLQLPHWLSQFSQLQF